LSQKGSAWGQYSMQFLRSLTHRWQLLRSLTNSWQFLKPLTHCWQFLSTLTQSWQAHLMTPSSSTPRDSLAAISVAYVGDTVNSLSADRKAAFIQLTFLYLRPLSPSTGLSAVSGSVSSYTYAEDGAQSETKEMYTLFSNHNRSFLRRQPGADGAQQKIAIGGDPCLFQYVLEPMQRLPLWRQATMFHQTQTLKSMWNCFCWHWSSS